LELETETNKPEKISKKDSKLLEDHFEGLMHVRYSILLKIYMLEYKSSGFGKEEKEVIKFRGG